KKPIYFDSYGDKLPAGALARMGTVRFRPGGPVAALAFSPNGKVLATLGSDSRIRLWDFATALELRNFPATILDDLLFSLCFSPDGKTLALSAGRDATIHLWDVETGKVVRRFENLNTAVTSLCFSPDGK